MWSDTLLALEHAHLLRLFAWSATSVVVGTSLYAVLTVRGIASVLLRQFAIQTVAWGLVNLVVAATGMLRLVERDLASATRLDRLLWLSLGLDAGVVLLGATLATTGWALSRRLGIVGAGIGVLVQGAGLLALDLRFVAMTARVL
jgi:hypothetical protein